MSNWKLALLAVLAPLTLSAAPKAPAVSCWLSWDLRDKDGVTLKNEDSELVKVTTKAPGKTELKGFALEAALRPGGAAGGSVAWYELNISIKHGENEAFRSDQTTNSHRQALGFIAGNERVFALCDIVSK